MLPLVYALLTTIFKYISCVGSSKSYTFELKIDWYLNTSHVSVQAQYDKNVAKRKRNLNTSHVSVQVTKKTLM